MKYSHVGLDCQFIVEIFMNELSKEKRYFNPNHIRMRRLENTSLRLIDIQILSINSDSFIHSIIKLVCSVTSKYNV